MNSPSITKQPGIFTNFPHCDCATSAEHDSGVSPCRSADHWRFALSNIRSKIFNESACAVPSPAMYLIAYERELQNRKWVEAESTSNVLKGCLDPASYNYNSEPLSSEDIFSYRISRSEHLILRLLQYFTKHASNNSFVRLSAGIFLVQKHKEGTVDLSTPRKITNALDFYINDDDPLVNTFSFNNLFHEMMEETNLPNQLQDRFIPYTYTLGARFTDPYHHRKDVLVKGNIPLWCQTLFITECMQRTTTLQQGTTHKGILPFAKDVEFKFSSLQQIHDSYPDLLIMFERFAAELSEPHMMFEIPTEQLDVWKSRELNIISGILYCEIPEDTAIIITNLANAWAISQGIPVL